MWQLILNSILKWMHLLEILEQTNYYWALNNHISQSQQQVFEGGV